MDLRDAHVLVTGATGGIGAALAEAFAARGARLTVTGRDEAALAAVAEPLHAEAIAADLAENDGPARLLSEVGRVDVLVANAGIPASGQDYDVEDIDRALAVNLRAPIVLSRLASQQMAERRRGHVVLLSSLSGKSASAHLALYNATKFGVRGYGLALRADLRPHGVGVSVLLPGPVRDAGMFSDAGVEIPRSGTVTAERVARAAVHATERDRGEVTVAPWPLRVGTAVGALLPGVTATIARRAGGDAMMEAVSRGQRDMH
ncbi:SDR family NAD(P)-dependent oxidoreductase [Tsukamurella sp. 8F]|uniref:SDR family NAD(P)-dependent oxidoreductase n=1 Tax=unclassified Tsukamurella TaxID=2633480 RepID=UPI0023B8EE2D|nr:MULTISPECIES: SDR family NAD(P)-dependent oxidoreductase [unclassified Tsukamurella]MDF0530506.1 SDR family NAD(P)-dependent oxidoreductase [Tsukamurella sp. 8J]MDF0586844.1 SDR family NAD(P)-dependent oxidoreductase [Tsukamurella sp. 8F]